MEIEATAAAVAATNEVNLAADMVWEMECGLEMDYGEVVWLFRAWREVKPSVRV